MATQIRSARLTNYVISGTQTPSGADVRGRIETFLESQDTATNTSYIRLEHYADTYKGSGAGDFIITPVSKYRANVGAFGGTYISRSKQISTSGQSTGTTVKRHLGTSYHTVQHNADGTGVLYVGGNFTGSTTIPAWNKTRGSSYNDVTLPSIPRYATINSFTLARASGAAGLSRLTCGWSANASCDAVQYSLNGGSWTSSGTSGTSGSFNVGGLTPNTQYSLKIRVKRTDSQLWTESSVKSATTYDIAKITVAPSNNVNMDNNQSITYTNPSGASLETSVYRTNASTVIAAYRACSGTSYTFAFTNAEKTAFYNQIPSTKTLPLRFYLRTSDGLGNSWLHFAERTFQVFNADPTFTTWTYADTNATTTALTGNNQKIIKGYSNVKATITSANKMVANKGASAISYLLTIGAKTDTKPYSSSSTVEMTINAVDNSVMTCYAIDSRNNSTPKAITASTFINYTPIAITAATGTRTDGIGTQTTLAYNGTFFNASFGSITNTIKSATYKFKKTTDANYTNGTSIITPTINGNKFSFSGLIRGDEGNGGVDGFDATYSYNVQVIVTDELSTHKFDFILGTGTPNIAMHRDGVAINQAYDETLGGALQVNGAVAATRNDVRVDGDAFIDFRTLTGNVRNGYLGYIPSFSAMALYNHNSGKFLKLKNNGEVVYDDKRLLTTNDLKPALKIIYSGDLMTEESVGTLLDSCTSSQYRFVIVKIRSRIYNWATESVVIPIGTFAIGEGAGTWITHTMTSYRLIDGVTAKTIQFCFPTTTSIKVKYNSHPTGDNALAIIGVYLSN